MILLSLDVIGYYNLLSIKKSVCNKRLHEQNYVCCSMQLLRTLWSDNGDIHENVTEK